MRRLVGAELSRLLSRRLTWLAAIAVLLAVAGLQFAINESVKPLSQAEIAQGKEQYEQARQDYEQNKADYERSEQECVDGGNPVEQCSMEPKPDQFTYRTPVPYDEIAEILIPTGVFLAGLALLIVGASFIGAEFTSGAIGNWLSFIPERSKVLAAKLVALGLAAAAGTAVALGLLIGVGALITRAADGVLGPTTKLWEMGARGVLIGVICAVVGFALALVTRHTIAAAGTVLGYLLVAYVLTGLGQSVPALQQVTPWRPEYNVLAFVEHEHTYTTYVTTVTSAGSEVNPVRHTISFAHSAWYWLVLMTLVIGSAFAVFRRRDVH
jgi:ABC-2 type transport system permease protein